ncbi:GNAT family N-acetyltransferase [Streptosporangium sp. NPDC002721]|uniref:GNAT family N-acetyltransferase n=1 Tax=Streptosporangium sp. NPDC002721 TaxID=3366188 RepID=UPI0036B884CE
MILTTGRLTLRPVGTGDIEALREHWDHPLVRRHLFDNEPVLPALVNRLVEESLRDFAERGYGLWALVPDSAMAGVCGLRGTPDGEVELLYSLSPGLWGQGLVTEAATAVLEYAFATLSLPRVIAEVDGGNAASARVALRLGMTREPASRNSMTREPAPGGSSGTVHRFHLTAPAKPETGNRRPEAGNLSPES